MVYCIFFIFLSLEILLSWVLIILICCFVIVVFFLIWDRILMVFCFRFFNIIILCFKSFFSFKVILFLCLIWFSDLVIEL